MARWDRSGPGDGTPPTSPAAGRRPTASPSSTWSAASGDSTPRTRTGTSHPSSGRTTTVDPGRNPAAAIRFSWARQRQRHVAAVPHPGLHLRRPDRCDRPPLEGREDVVAQVGGDLIGRGSPVDLRLLPRPGVGAERRTASGRVDPGTMRLVASVRARKRSASVRLAKVLDSSRPVWGWRYRARQRPGPRFSIWAMLALPRAGGADEAPHRWEGCEHGVSAPSTPSQGRCRLGPTGRCPFRTREGRDRPNGARIRPNFCRVASRRAWSAARPA